MQVVGGMIKSTPVAGHGGGGVIRAVREQFNYLAVWPY